MWAIITRSEVGTVMKLYPKIMSAFYPYHWLLTSLYGDVLPTDHVREQIGSSLIRDIMLSAEVREIGESVRCYSCWFGRFFPGRYTHLQLSA
jgi:hypothetical protein